jgi:hypothetical protein
LSISVSILQVIDQEADKEEEVSVAEFALDEMILESYNAVDEEEIMAAFDEFENEYIENSSSEITRKPVTIQDSKLFHQLADRFGHPEGVGVITDGMFAAIPDALAKEIYDWWNISIMDRHTDLGTSDLLRDEQLALAMHDEELALKLQLEYNSVETPKTSQEDNQEFPALSGPVKTQVKPAGDWTRVKGVGFSGQLKIQKLMKLFPNVPETRLNGILEDNQGSMEATIKTLCYLLEKDPRELNKKREQTSITNPPKIQPG